MPTSTRYARLQSQSEMLRRTDSFLLYTLGETFHSLPSRQDKKFMTNPVTKQSTIHVLAFDYDSITCMTEKRGFQVCMYDVGSTLQRV
jgi:hypothetical protein